MESLSIFTICVDHLYSSKRTKYFLDVVKNNFCVIKTHRPGSCNSVFECNQRPGTSILSSSLLKCNPWYYWTLGALILCNSIKDLNLPDFQNISKTFLQQGIIWAVPKNASSKLTTDQFVTQLQPIPTCDVYYNSRNNKTILLFLSLIYSSLIVIIFH